MMRDDCEHVIKMLVERYPKCFFDYPRLRRPLKKTIVDDLLSDGFAVAPDLIRASVEWYQSNLGYQYAMQAGSKRLNLNGKEVGTVTEQEALASQIYIKNRREVKAPVQLDPVARLQIAVDAVRRVMADAELRAAFAVPRLSAVIAEAQNMIETVE
jgi:sRNA-binding protein